MPVKIDADATASHKTLLLFTLLLFSGKRHYLSDLTETLQCSKATVMRLMQTIELSGVAMIESGLDKGRRWYQLKTLPGTPHIGLTDKEVERLALCRDMVERLLPQGIEKVISDSIAKVSTLMVQPEHRAAATAPKAVRVVRGYIDYSPFQGHIDCLLRAIDSKAVCAISYRTPGKKGPRTFYVLPVRLAVENETLNMEGWRVTGAAAVDSDPTIRFPMTLAVQRMETCAMTETALPDCPALPKKRGLFGLIGRDSFTIRVAFNRYAAIGIKERIWSEDQCIKNLRGGGIELTCSAADEAQVVEWVLSFGGSAELMEPAHLRERLRGEIDEMRLRYGEA